VINQDFLSNNLSQSESKERKKDYTSSSRSRMQKNMYCEKMQKINKDLPPPPNEPTQRNSFLQELKEDDSRTHFNQTTNYGTPFINSVKKNKDVR